MPPPIPISNAERARQAAGLLERGQLKQAERVLKDVLKAEPRQFDALLWLGVLHGMRGDDTTAARLLEQAAARNPLSDAAHYNLGQALIRLGRHDDAVEALTKAESLTPNAAHVHEKLGDSLRQLGRLEAAAHHFTRAVELAGQRAGTMLLSSLVEAKRRICDWTGLDALETRLLSLIARGEPGEPLLLSYLTDDAQLLKRNAVTYATRFLPAVLPAALAKPQFTHKPRPRQRIRIGYLCSDFREHATAHLTAGLFEQHDRIRFETYALSFGPNDKSAMRGRLERAFSHFIDLEGAASEQIVKRIAGLGIDVLVDLNGYIANARPEILMARPAPVQAHFLAFPGTLGSAAIDYQIVDPVIAPAAADDQFTEALARLPHCYQPNDNLRPGPGERPDRSALGLPADAVVLASFNNAIKLTPAVFAIWMRLLATVPQSVLWLYAENETVTRLLRAAASTSGIAPERVIAAGKLPPADHIARLAAADLLLDSFPYGAHTTASDALWAGVPLLTVTGRAFAARVSTSLVTAAGVPELAMPSLEAYEREAIALAQSPQRIAELKARIAANRSTCPLFDTAGFTRALEQAYSTMWARFCAGEKPASFEVPQPNSSANPMLPNPLLPNPMLPLAKGPPAS